jgi:hypothetical protein
MGHNKATRLEWGQWDLNPAGKWVQLHYFSDECIWPSTLSFFFEASSNSIAVMMRLSGLEKS